MKNCSISQIEEIEVCVDENFSSYKIKTNSQK